MKDSVDDATERSKGFILAIPKMVIYKSKEIVRDTLGEVDGSIEGYTLGFIVGNVEALKDDIPDGIRLFDGMLLGILDKRSDGE